MKLGWMAGLLAVCSVTGEAHAAGSAIANLCASYEAQTQALTMTVRSRCLSSGKRTVSNTLALNVDQSTATIRVDGDLSAQYAFHIGPADCMGTINVPLTATGIEPRRYHVMLGETFLGHFDLTQGLGQAPCFGGEGQKPGRHVVREKDYADWSLEMVPGWQDWRGADLPALIAPLMGGFPDIMEGRPSVTLSIKPSRWAPGAVAKRYPYPRQLNEVMIVELTQQGFADDSISAQRYAGIAKLGAKGWYFDRLYAQSMCARGPQAGQWHGSACP